MQFPSIHSNMESLKLSNCKYVVTEEGKVVQQFELADDSALRFKRVTNSAETLWAISSDNKIYLRVETALEVIKEESYENQRWDRSVGEFTNQLLPTDERSNFSSEDGKATRDFDSVNLPNELWVWDDSWQLELTQEGAQLSELGWNYAFDFNCYYTPTMTTNSYVRRRKWVRNRRYNQLNQWALLPNSLKESFVDIAAGGDKLPEAAPGLVFLWAVTEEGILFLREGVNRIISPEGDQWLKIETPVPISRVSASPKGVVLILGRDERIFALNRQNAGYTWKESSYPKEKVTFDDIAAFVESSEAAQQPGFSRAVKVAGAVAGGLGIGILAGIAAPFAIPALLGTVGFTSSGVAAGSIAAGIQASIGNVAAGSLFAMCQSVGAAGIASSTAATIGGWAAAAGGTLAGMFAAKATASNGTEEEKQNKEAKP